MNRAERRQHRERLKKKRRFNWGRDLSKEPKYLAMAVNTPHPCSCLCCGNERKHSGDTMQERRADSLIKINNTLQEELELKDEENKKLKPQIARLEKALGEIDDGFIKNIQTKKRNMLA